jgi:hypothetical protein
MFISKEVSKILEDFHEGPVSGHFGMNTNVRKILFLGYWWPTMHKDVELCQKCDICQHLKPICRNGKEPLEPIMAFEPFMKWGLDFMGPTKLTTTDYATRWVKAEALCDITIKNITKFVFEQIITHFGCPIDLVSDKSNHFINRTIEILVE